MMAATEEEQVVDALEFHFSAASMEKKKKRQLGATVALASRYPQLVPQE